MKTKLFIFLLAIAAFVSCTKNESVKDQLEDIIVVNAILEINKPIESIVLSRLNPLNDNVTLDDIDADVSIVFQNEEYILDELSANVYGLTDESIKVTADAEYELISNHNNKTLSSIARTPEICPDWTLTKSDVFVGNIGDQIDVTFDELPGVDVFYLVKIVPLSEVLEPIMIIDRPEEDEKSLFVYNGGNNVVSVLGSYFSYLGPHEIVIERINEDFYPLFSAVNDGNQNNSSSNITNGLGTFVGAERISFEITVQ